LLTDDDTVAVTFGQLSLAEVISVASGRGLKRESRRLFGFFGASVRGATVDAPPKRSARLLHDDVVLLADAGFVLVFTSVLKSETQTDMIESGSRKS
jgi:anti-sigma factor ChrR (cupin superfamily)